MTDTERLYQAGYRDPVRNEWVAGVSDDPNAEVGYFDIELGVWDVGFPDLGSGEWLPDDAIVATDRECPPDFPIKGNFPSRVYHLPDQPSYERTVPEICFANEDAARLAGFRPSLVGRRHESRDA